MGTRGSCAVLLVFGCLALSAVGVATADFSEFGPAQQSIVADTVSLRVEVDSDGAADWQVTYRRVLEDTNETDAFRGLRDDIRANPGAYVDRFGDRMRRAARTAENSTGREMAIHNVSVDARLRSLPQGTVGVVTFRFSWANFAIVDGDRLRAGDAIDELFLDDSTSLTVAWPENYHQVSHRPDATSVDNGSVTWQGRRDFGPGEPRVVVGPGPIGGTGSGLSPVVVAVVGIAVFALLSGLGLWLYRRHGRDGPANVAEESAAEGDTTGVPSDALLSNEERVLRVLDEHGGRVKQQQVAEELDWTAAKTSQVVSDLRDADRLESFRLGRENVLTLPDVSIEADEED